MSSVVRTSHTPYFSFQRSSTPTPYSVGKPTLNCCGGSFRTFGNMKRPVAARAAADAAENAPHARPSQARRVSSGDVSSGSRVAVAALAAAGAVVAVRAAAPPADATEVVFPARSGIGAGAGRGAAAAGAGFAACAPAGGAAAPGAGAGLADGVVVCCGVAAGFAPAGGAFAAVAAAGVSVFVSSAIYPITFSASSVALRTFKLRSDWLSAVTDA